MRVAATYRRSIQGLALLVALASGCGETAYEPLLRQVDGPVPAGAAIKDLLPSEGWQVDPARAAIDAETYGPFAPCRSPVPRIEDGLVEFDTGSCEAYTVRAPMGHDLQPGDWLEIVMSHSILQAPEAAQGRLVLRVQDDDVWQWERLIPGPAAASTIYLVVQRPIEAGHWLGVHVSNHGANQWRLVRLRRYRDS